jgi:hypothetical protein
MFLKHFTFLLILALLSARVDDLQAAATPDPYDDVLAAQDNTYVAVVYDARLRTSLDAEWPMYRGMKARASGALTTASAGDLPALAVPFLTLYPNPLYVLASLQC